MTMMTVKCLCVCVCERRITGRRSIDRYYQLLQTLKMMTCFVLLFFCTETDKPEQELWRACVRVCDEIVEV